MSGGRRLRVLRIITRLNVGGPATHVTLLDQGLAERGWETMLLYGQVEPTEAELPMSGSSIPRRRIPALRRPIRPLDDARAFASVVREIRSLRPHVIHTHLSKAGLVGRVAAIATSRAVRVHTFHGTLFGDYFGPTATRAIVRAEQMLGQRTDRIIAISSRQRDELVLHRIAPADRIRIVPLGLDLSRFEGLDRGIARARLAVAPDALLIVAVGRLVAVKRLDRLIAAFAEVHNAIPSARLVLVGDGDERAALADQAARSPASAAIVFAGWTTVAEAWYAAADIVALTSEREGTPLALIEAAAAGRPVVATDAGGVADIVADGRTGFVVRRDDPDALRDRLRLLASDAGIRREMGLRAATAAQGYAASRLVDDIDALYREALIARGPRG
jgi:glycosyltransferase involved in cell wall biosynthesis